MNPIPESWRAVAVVVCLIAATAALYWFLYSFDPFGRREKAEARATAATAQSDLNAGATQTVEHVLRTETFVRTQAEEASHAIAIAPGADAPVPDDVLSAWRAGVVGVRQAPAAGSDPGS